MAAFPFPGWQTSANGTTLASGAKIDFYVPGTARGTRRTPFTDEALTVPTTNPVILNSSGWPSTNIYLDSTLAYEYEVVSADGATVYVPLTVLPAGGASGAQPLNTLLTNISSVTLGNNQFLKGTGTPNTPVAFSLFGTENTWTKKQTFDLAGSETANGIDVQIGATGDLRATEAQFGYVGHNVEVYTNQDGTGDGITFGVAGRAYAKDGSRGIVAGLYGFGKCDTDWEKGSGTEAGAQGAFLDGTTTKAGTVFGAGIHATATTTAGAIIRGVEADTTCTTVSNVSKIGVEVVSPAADTGSTTGTVTISGGAALEDSAGFRIFAVTGGVGFSSGIMTIKRSDTAAPVKSGGDLWSSGGFTTNYGLNWRSMTFTGAAFYLGNNQPIMVVRNAANSADLEMLRVDASDRLSLRAGVVTLSATGGAIYTPTSGTDAITINRPSGQTGFFGITTGGLQRWKFGGSIGAESGSNAGTEFAIARYDDAGTVIENAMILRRSDGRVTMQGVYNITTATAANVNVDSSGIVQRSTSALKYKKDVEPFATDRAWPMLEAIDDALIWYRSNTELCAGDNPSHGHYGVAADPLAEVIPQMVHFGAEGQVEGFAYERVIVPLVRAVIELRRELNQRNAPPPEGPEQDYKAMYEELKRNMHAEEPKDVEIPAFLNVPPAEVASVLEELGLHPSDSYERVNEALVGKLTEAKGSAELARTYGGMFNGKSVVEWERKSQAINESIRWNSGRKVEMI